MTCYVLSMYYPHVYESEVLGVYLNKERALQALAESREIDLASMDIDTEDSSQWEETRMSYTYDTDEGWVKCQLREKDVNTEGRLANE